MTYFELLNSYKYDGDIEKEAIEFIIKESLHVSSLVQVIYDEVDDDVLKNVKRYLDGEAPQYIVGHTYFYGLKINVNPNCLIPRFDTESVVEEAVKIIKKRGFKKVLDGFTGSGAIALAVKKETLATVDAFDISLDALDVAKNNSKELGLDVNFFQSDVFHNVKDKYDILIANPPYIAYGDIEVEKIVDRCEPHLALYADEDGLKFYRLIMENFKEVLNEHFAIVMEIPYNKVDELTKIAKDNLLDARFVKDLAGNYRVMIIEG